MPAGLDGNQHPVVTPDRDVVLDAVAALVCGHPGPRTSVGIDGRSGSGKSTFADELETRIQDRGRRTVRSTTDAFHRPRVERMRRGPTSAEGYYLDSHQLDVIVDELLTPFARGAPTVRTAAFDEPSDSPDDHRAAVAADAVLVFDGLFLQRSELADHWDVTVHLLADERCDREWLEFLSGDLPETATARAAALDARLALARWPRYRDGWRRYVDEVDPVSRATVVIDNDDLLHPVLLRCKAR